MAAWSELPPELLMEIGKCLDTSLDILRLGGVCKSWRNALSPFKSKSSSTLPRVVLPSIFTFDGYASSLTRHHYDDSPPYLVQSTIWSVQPSGEDQSYRSWLVNVTEEEPRGKWLSNPVYGTEYRHHASAKCLSLNLLNLRIYEHGRYYILEQEIDMGGTIPISLEVKTVVLSDSVWSERSDYKILTFVVPHLLLWESGDEKWTEVKGGKGFEFDDIAVCEGNFFVVDAKGMVFRVDLSAKKLVEYSPAIVGNSMKLLVVFDGDLYVVARCLVKRRKMYDFNEVIRARPKGFKVYRLGKGVGAPWVEVNDLGNRSLFLAEHWSFFVSAKECNGCRENCIYHLVQISEGDHHAIVAFDFKAQRKCDIANPPWIKP